MADNPQDYKFKKTGVLDSIFVLVSVIFATISFALGFFILGLGFMCISVGFFAKQIILKSYKFAIPVAIIGLALSILISYFIYKGESLLPSILAQTYIVAGCVFAICLLSKKSKSFTTVCVSICIFAFFIISIVYQYYMKTGTLTTDGFVEYINQFFETIKTEMITTINSMNIPLGNTTVEEYVSDLVDVTKFVCPGFVVMVSEVCALICTSTFSWAIKISNAHVLIPGDWKIMPNKASAYLQLVITGFYILQTILAMFGIGMNVILYSTLNLLMIFAPQFVIVGLSRFFPKKGKPRAFGGGYFFAFTIILFAIISPVGAFVILNFYGVVSILLKAKIEERMQKDEERIRNERYYNPDDEEYRDDTMNYYNNMRNGYERDDIDDNYDDRYDDYDDIYDDDDDDRYDEYNDDRYRNDEKDDKNDER